MSVDKCSPQGILSLDDPRTGDDLKACTFSESAANQIASDFNFEGKLSQRDAATLVNAYNDMWYSPWFKPETAGDNRVIRIGQRLAAVAGIPTRSSSSALEPPRHPGFNARVDRYFTEVQKSFVSNPEGHRLINAAALSEESIKIPGSHAGARSLEAAVSQAMAGVELVRAPDSGGTSFSLSEHTITELADLVERLGQTGTPEERHALALELAYADKNRGNSNPTNAYARFSDFIAQLRYAVGMGTQANGMIGFSETSGGDLSDITDFAPGIRLGTVVDQFIAQN